MLELLDEMRMHLNIDHHDTVSLIAQFVATQQTGERGSAAPIEASDIEGLRSGDSHGSIEAVDADGLDVAIGSHARGHRRCIRHSFSAPCSSVDDVSAEFHSLLQAARAWIGDALPLTSFERELAVGHLRTFVTRVGDVRDITPNLRQITFEGGLDDFVSIGGDQFLYVLLPPPGRSELTVDAGFSWASYEAMDPADRPVGAYYSVRAWNPATRRLDMWFVLHGDDGAASSWAQRVEPGSPVALWGPRTAYDPPATTSSHLIVVDETGFGAACAVLDQLLAADPLATVHLLAEVGDASGRVDVPAGPRVTVSWLDRGGAPPGSTSALVDAVRDTAVADDVYAFGAGESRRITEVRRHLR
ncbi:MAG: siderophore-interacting protein, partial [Ilumatobacter sp.]